MGPGVERRHAQEHRAEGDGGAPKDGAGEKARSPHTWLSVRLPSKPGDGVQVRSPEHPGLLGHRAVSASFVPDRQTCSQHADNDQASAPARLRGCTDTPDTENGAFGQPAMHSCNTPGIPCIFQMAAPGSSPYTCSSCLHRGTRLT